jgi:hypothetical protein
MALLRHKKDISWEILLETDKAFSSDSNKEIDTDTDRGHDKEPAAASQTQAHIC